MHDGRVFIFGEIPGVPRHAWDRLRVSTEKFYKGFPCWEWQRAKSSGYGYFSLDGKLHRVHRFIYLTGVGTADGLTIDHLCRNRCCANPEHLEAVTNEENIRRGEWRGSAVRVQLEKDTCPNGHLYTEDTLYVSPNRRDRQCKICMKETGRKWKQKNKEKVLERQRIRRAAQRDHSVEPGDA